MDLQISAFLLFVLFTAGHSLSCYQCRNETSSCADHEVITCPSGYSKCISMSIVSKFGETIVNGKYCAGYCANESINYGFVKASYSCCDTDLCNVQDSPDPSTNTPTGNKCYYCDEQSCSNTVNCSGSEDRCITIKVNFNKSETILKGCVSKSICDHARVSFSSGISCCEGNLCNDVYSVTQNINFIQNINIIQNITHNVLQSTNSATGITQSILLLLIVYLSKQSIIQ